MALVIETCLKICKEFFSRTKLKVIRVQSSDPNFKTQIAKSSDF